MQNYSLNILVIIVTFNGEKWIEKCINSALLNNPKEIMVIDNGSSDNTVSIIKENFPEVNLVISEKNLGFGAANNIGFKRALECDFDYIYLLNQDAWVDPGTFEKLISQINNNTTFGILSPLQIIASGKALDKNFSKCCPPEMISDVLCDKLKTLYETRFVMAAHWLIPRNIIEEIGGFSPAFPHYGEDNNFVQRVLFKKYKIGISTICRGVHDREFRKNSKQKDIYMNFIQALIILENPFNSHRFLKVINYYIHLLFSQHNKNDLNYLLKILSHYPKLNKIFRNSFKKKAFLN